MGNFLHFAQSDVYRRQSSDSSFHPVRLHDSGTEKNSLARDWDGSFTANCAAGGTLSTVINGNVGDTFDVTATTVDCAITTSTGGVVSWAGGSVGGSNPSHTDTGPAVTVTLASVGTTTYSLLTAGNGRPSR